MRRAPPAPFSSRCSRRLRPTARQPAARLPRTRTAGPRRSPATPGGFREDHGSHPPYRIEWWYYTGNLEAAGGRAFGYQVTFFRVGVDPAPENPSRWAVRDLYMAHLALTDLSGGRHLFAERLDRGGLGWAGARSGTLDVWNGDWRAALDGGRHRLDASNEAFGIDLHLEPGPGPTRHGRTASAGRGRRRATPRTTTP